MWCALVPVARAHPRRRSPRVVHPTLFYMLRALRTLPLVSCAGLRGASAASQRSRNMAIAVGTRVEHAKRVLERADAVCFDVDSTVVTSEGIDDLAAHLETLKPGVGAKVAELTAKAMGGSVPFHEALAARLVHGQVDREERHVAQQRLRGRRSRPTLQSRPARRRPT